MTTDLRCPCCGDETDTLVFVPGIQWVPAEHFVPERDRRRLAREIEQNRRDRRRRQKQSRRRNRR